MRAKLSSTLANMARLQFLLLLRVPGAFGGERLVAQLSLDDAPPALNERGGYRLQENAFRRGLNHGLGSILNVELLTQPCGNDDLPFGGEPNGIGLYSYIHGVEDDLVNNVRQWQSCKAHAAQSDTLVDW